MPLAKERRKKTLEPSLKRRIESLKCLVKEAEDLIQRARKEISKMEGRKVSSSFLAVASVFLA